MSSLPKKNPSKAKEAEFSGWHPNFRDFSQLPDTKVVRTSFFVNVIAAFVMLGVLLFFVYQEYSLHILDKQIEEWSVKIEQQQGPNGQALASYKRFQEEQRKITEIDEFLAGEQLPFSEFVISFGESLPRKVALTYLDYNSSGVTLRGLVKGEPDLASGIASDFEKQLREDPGIKKRFANVGITTLSRDAQSGQLTFEIVMRFDVGGKKK